jgi:hypothetical protein
MLGLTRQFLETPRGVAVNKSVALRYSSNTHSKESPHESHGLRQSHAEQ